MELIETVTVGSGGAALIEFTSIAADWTDLLLVLSLRSSSTTDSAGIKFNATSGSYSMRRLVGTGSSVFSDAPSQPLIYVGDYPGSGQTANTFGSVQIYIPNYGSSASKSVSVDAVSENNATAAVQSTAAGLWANSAAISSLVISRIDGASGSFAEYSSASLYGIASGSDGTTTVT